MQRIIIYGIIFGVSLTIVGLRYAISAYVGYMLKKEKTNSIVEAYKIYFRLESEKK